MRALKDNEELVRSQHGAGLLISRVSKTCRLAAIWESEDGEWRPATYEDLLDFILGKPAPAEDRMLAADLGAAFAPVQDTGALACP